MEPLISPIILGAYGLAAALIVLLVHLLRFEVDPQEPPVVYPTIPLVGHIIGTLTDGALYLRRLG